MGCGRMIDGEAVGSGRVRVGSMSCLSEVNTKEAGLDTGMGSWVVGSPFDNTCAGQSRQGEDLDEERLHFDGRRWIPVPGVDGMLLGFGFREMARIEKNGQSGTLNTLYI